MATRSGSMGSQKAPRGHRRSRIKAEEDVELPDGSFINERGFKDSFQTFVMAGNRLSLKKPRHYLPFKVSLNVCLYFAGVANSE